MRYTGFIREIQLLRECVPSFDRYPYSMPAVRNLRTLPLDPRITFFIGENGSGKSTLVEAIAICAGLNPEGGTKNFNYALRPTESPLHEVLRLVRNVRREKAAFFLRAETMFNVATEVERLGVPGWKNIHIMSHGEAFLWVVRNRFRPSGLYILDEPESALSPQRQLALLRLFHDLITAGAQLIVSTHSPILMAYPGATIYQLGETGIARVPYEETEHYLVTRSFLEHRELSLRELFDKDS